MPLLSLKNIPRDDCLLEAAKQEPGMDPTACALLLNLLRTGDEVFRVMDINFAKHGLSEGRFMVLMLLSRNVENGAPLNTPAELAKFSGVTRATMTGLIDTLERDGLVTRIPDVNDRRMMNVHITTKGKDVLAAMLPEHFRRMGAVMADLSEPERAQLIALLSKIYNRAEKIDPSVGAV